VKKENGELRDGSKSKTKREREIERKEGKKKHVACKKPLHKFSSTRIMSTALHCKADIFLVGI
jgi:hypothetical protein